jgi:hypothetical protein
MAGTAGDPGERKQDGFTTQLFVVVATIAATIASGVGNIIANDFQHRQPLMFALLGGFSVFVSGAYLLRQRRARQGGAGAGEPVPPPQPPRILAPGPGPVPGPPPQAMAEPAPLGRTWVVIAMCALVVAAFFAGFWTIGNGFAHSASLGWLALASVAGCVAVAVSAAWYFRRRRWAAWLLPGSRAVMAAAVAALGLSAGGTLGTVDLVPHCPVPVELPVLTSSEALPGVQNAIIMFQGYERSIQSCYAADLTAYAAPSDAAADAALESGWSPVQSASSTSALAVPGPRPAIWIPASTRELSAVSGAVARKGARAAPQLRSTGSVARSDLVVAVPLAIVSRDSSFDGTAASGRLGDIYGLLAENRVSLGLPSPKKSEAGLLGVTGLFSDIAPGKGKERAIEASGSFPADSGTLLCAAAQAAQQAPGHQLPPVAYLVSKAAVNLSNQGLLTELPEGACSTLTAQPPSLHPLTPSDGTSLDFPFATVSWGGPADQPARIQEQRQRMETDFRGWLASPAGQRALGTGGLGPPRGPTAQLPGASQVTAALNRFTHAQAPARVLIALDDSGPMEPYLPQAEAAAAGAVAPGTGPGGPSRASSGPLGGQDSFGVWAFPGPGTATHADLVPFGAAAPGRLGAVTAGVARLKAHGHSAQYDLLTQAASLLYQPQPGGGPAGAGPATNSVILLTDGDGYSTEDPGGNNFKNVTRTALRPPSLPASSRIKVLVIAFGPTGCAQTSASAAQSLAALATSTGGTCVNATGDLTRQLSLLISQVAGG